MTTSNPKFLYFLLLTGTLIYLIFGVGIHGDDYTEIIGMKDYGFWDFIYPDPYKHTIQLLGLPNFYVYWWAYPVLGNELALVYDVIKVLVHLISIYLIYIFAKDYFEPDRAFLFAIFFILYPLHESTTYWYMTLYYITIPAILMYAHSLIYKNRLLLGFFCALLGGMWHYASPPYIFGLSLVFFIKKQFKKGFIFSIPGFLYLSYYFWFKNKFPDVERRINSNLDFSSFLKNLVLQKVSFLEAAFGPSYWLKILFSISSLSIISIIILAFLSFIAFKKWNLLSSNKFDFSLFIGIISVVFLSFAMFSLTGLYSHSAFNLGNRTTIYGSMLIAFLLATFLKKNKVSLLIVIFIFLIPTFSLSDHWKSWNINQKEIIYNINNNDDLKNINSESTLIVIGNNYSKLGPFSHIEFFSMPWHVNAVFKNNTSSNKVIALQPYSILNNDILVDQKYGIKYPLSEKIYLYNSKENTLNLIAKEDIEKILSEQSNVIRHWTQLFKNSWIQDTILWLSPRLKYLFE